LFLVNENANGGSSGKDHGTQHEFSHDFNCTSLACRAGGFVVLSLVMLADFLLRLLGRNPAAYPGTNKWPTIAADLIDFSIPYILVFLFFLPLLIMWWATRRRGRKFSDLSIYAIVAALVIGALLSYGGYWLNEWSYGYGVGVIFNEIHGY
jgi:uncharacterized membrane protein